LAGCIKPKFSLKLKGNWEVRITQTLDESDLPYGRDYERRLLGDLKLISSTKCGKG
jgi:hypothetical protein